MAMPSVSQMEAFIRAEAARLGINPDVAVAVARSEGLQPGTWQSNVQQPYGRERSYGPFQLHVAPEGGRPGMGNDFVKATGLDPADPTNWQAATSYGLEQARRGGWGPWFGAKKIGITGMEGIDGRTFDYVDTPQAAPPPPDREDRGGQYNSGLGTAAPGGLLEETPDYSNSAKAPSQDDSFDFDKLKDVGGKIAKLAADQEEEARPAPPPQALVLQPLRRVTLGKGLLG